MNQVGISDHNFKDIRIDEGGVQSALENSIYREYDQSDPFEFATVEWLRLCSYIQERREETVCAICFMMDVICRRALYRISFLTTYSA